MPVPLFIYRDTPPAEVGDQLGTQAGRFRLDAVDSDGQLVDGVLPGEIRRDAPAAAPAPATPAPTSQLGSDVVVGALLDLVKSVQAQSAAQLHAQSVQFTAQLEALVSQTSGVMRASAELLTAADGAGLSRRRPPIDVLAEPRNAAPAEDAAAASAATQIVDKVLSVTGPLISLFVARLAGAPAPGPTPANANAAPSPATAPPAPAAPATDAAPAVAASSAAPSAAPSPFTAAQLEAHLLAMRAHLSGVEMAQAHAVMAAMPPEQIDQWTVRLMQLSPGDAAALVRRALAQGVA